MCSPMRYPASVLFVVILLCGLLLVPETSQISFLSLPLRQIPYGGYGGYAGVSQTENVELTERDKEIIQRLKDWDLWGPLIVCLALAVLLSLKAPVGKLCTTILVVQMSPPLLNVQSHP